MGDIGSNYYMEQLKMKQKKLVSEEEFDYITEYLGLPYKAICLKLVALCQQRYEEYSGGK